MNPKVELVKLAIKRVAIAKQAYCDALGTEQEAAAFEALREARKEHNATRKQLIAKNR